ncbi:MAG: lysylphosphatidylglycerol synthase transmembrane domain-containing protein [Thermodesulfobacteriota bacterium]|nr:lysylphosphatidylglycerol synthase transmembrane domain-containing protein [Thermodesulfobacteriota bacterium]
MRSFEKSIKSWVSHIIASAFGIGILIGLIYYAGYERILTIILQTSPYWIVASLINYAISWYFRTWRLERFTTSAGKNIKKRDLFKINISGYALNTILPAKLGDVATAGFLKLKGFKIGNAAAIILQTRILDVLALIILSIPTILLSFEGKIPWWIQVTLFFCIIMISVPFCIVILDKYRIVSLFFDKLVKRCVNNFLKLTVLKIKDAYESYHRILSNTRLLTETTLLSILIWLFDGLTCYMVSVAVGKEISLIVIILSFSIGNLGKSVPFTPGGIGMYEGILASCLVLFEVSFDIAVTIAILDHAIKKIFNLIFGLPAAMVIGAIDLRRRHPSILS